MYYTTRLHFYYTILPPCHVKLLSCNSFIDLRPTLESCQYISFFLKLFIIFFGPSPHCGYPVFLWNFYLQLPSFSVFWSRLTPKWQHVTVLWIINEDSVIFKNECRICISHPKISHHTKFQIFLTLVDTNVTTEYVTFLWIINEDSVIFKNECRIWIFHPKISHHTKFQLGLTLFRTKVKICNFYMNN